MVILTSRRAVLGGIVVSAALPTIARAQLGFADFPFPLGVSSGDASPDGFVLWTRLAPRPLEPHGGMPLDPVPVGWEVAEDDGFRTITAKGTETARPELGHAVHVEVAGLKPGRTYWYHFTCAASTARSAVRRRCRRRARRSTACVSPRSAASTSRRAGTPRSATSRPNRSTSCFTMATSSTSTIRARRSTGTSARSIRCGSTSVASHIASTITANATRRICSTPISRQRDRRTRGSAPTTITRYKTTGRA